MVPDWLTAFFVRRYTAAQCRALAHLVYLVTTELSDGGGVDSRTAFANACHTQVVAPPHLTVVYGPVAHVAHVLSGLEVPPDDDAGIARFGDAVRTLILLMLAYDARMRCVIMTEHDGHAKVWSTRPPPEDRAHRFLTDPVFFGVTDAYHYETPALANDALALEMRQTALVQDCRELWILGAARLCPPPATPSQSPRKRPRRDDTKRDEKKVKRARTTQYWTPAT